MSKPEMTVAKKTPKVHEKETVRQAKLLIHMRILAESKGVFHLFVVVKPVTYSRTFIIADF